MPAAGPGSRTTLTTNPEQPHLAGGPEPPRRKGTPAGPAAAAANPLLSYLLTVTEVPIVARDVQSRVARW